VLKIGITGGIGSGKSIVCSIFKLLGVPVYHADDHAKYLIENDTDIRAQIISLFGNKAYNGNIYNRKYIASIVFTNDSLLTKLNEVVHPHVAKDFTLWAEQFNESDYIVEEAAILFESNANKKMDYNILVDAPEELRIERVMKRDHLNEEEVRKRIRKQFSTVKIRHLVDWIIVNNNKQLILPQILKIHSQLKSNIHK
jgi:dephospho-CoA kinase